MAETIRWEIPWGQIELCCLMNWFLKNQSEMNWRKNRLRNFISAGRSTLITANGQIPTCMNSWKGKKNL